jgi:hypothetical protein
VFFLQKERHTSPIRHSEGQSPEESSYKSYSDTIRLYWRDKFAFGGLNGGINGGINGGLNGGIKRDLAG